MMVDWAINAYAESGFVKFFTWFPVVVNSVVYPIHVWKRIQKDRKDLAEDGKGHVYDPVTVGHLFKYLGLTLLPAVNLCAMLFHTGPIAWEWIYNRFKWFFSIRLVDGKKVK